MLTNDGDLTQLLTHPSHGVAKTYLAEVEGVPTPGELRTLRTGVDLDDGPTAPATVTLVQERAPGAAIELTIHEGRNRQVRRMCEAIGHPVRRLVRTRIGPLADWRLPPGEWRVLTPTEVRELYQAATVEAAHESAGDSHGREPVELSAAPRLTSLGVRLQALRGAITCDEDSKIEIDTKVSRLVKELFARNDLSNDDVVSMIFTATPDLTSQFPATSARAGLDLGDIPLLGAQEQAVPHGTPLCPRADPLLHRTTARRAAARVPRRCRCPSPRPRSPRPREVDGNAAPWSKRGVSRSSVRA